MAECELEGKDSRVLELDPELPLKGQLDDIYCNDPKSRHLLLLGWDAIPDKEDTDNVVDYVSNAFSALASLQVPTLPHRRCLLYTSPSPRDKRQSRMPSSA